MISIFFNLIRDARCHKGALFIMLVQIIATAVILCYGISVCIDGMTMSRQVKDFDKSYSIVKLADNLESNQFNNTYNDKEKKERMSLLTEYFDEADNLEYIVLDSSSNISLSSDSGQMDEAFLKNVSVRCDDNSAEIDTVRVNDRFFDFFHIRTQKRPFVDDNGTIHVILGSSFTECMKTGDVFYDSLGVKHIVEGFVKEGSFYTNPYRKTETCRLDNTVIYPLDDSIDDEPLFKILHTFLIITDKETGLKDLQNEMDRLDIDWFYIDDYTSHVKLTIMELWSEIIMILIAALLLGVFAAIGTIAMMLNYIDEHLYEFSVHRVCGASSMNIIIRMIMPLLITTLIGAVITILIFGVCASSIFAISLMIIFGAVIIIYPVRVLGRIDIVNELRNRR